MFAWYVCICISLELIVHNFMHTMNIQKLCWTIYERFTSFYEISSVKVVNSYNCDLTLRIMIVQANVVTLFLTVIKGISIIAIVFVRSNIV